MDKFIYGVVVGMIGMFAFLILNETHEYGAHWLEKGITSGVER